MDTLGEEPVSRGSLEEELPAVETTRAGAPALLEVIDRDGHVRQSWSIPAWPTRVGRGLDNDIVLSDPYVAAQHFRIESVDGGLALRVGETVNGVTVAGRHVDRDGLAPLPLDREAIDIVAGRTRLRLRLAEATLAAETALASIVVRNLRVGPTLVLGAILVAGVTFGTWLEADPDNFVRALGSALITGATAAAIWCGAWALLSKTITRQAHLGWHLRVFVIGALSMLGLAAVPGLVAFSLSWPWVTDYSFIASFAVGAAALYFHLLAAEPARPRLLRWVVATGAVVGIGLTLWFNLQRTSSPGDELYMSHLYPPALRLARPLATERFVKELTPLHALLDRKAKEPASADDNVTKGSDDDE